MILEKGVGVGGVRYDVIYFAPTLEGGWRTILT